MSDISLIILSAGNSTRFNSVVKKQWIRIKDKPLWLFVADKFAKIYKFKDIIITSSKDELKYKEYLSNYKIVLGGNSRQESIKNALDFVDTKYVLVTDVARACISKKVVKSLIKNKNKADIIVPFLKATDTIVYENETIDRDYVKLIQTPQLSKTDILKKAISQKEIFTDDSSSIKSLGGSVYYIKGSKKLHKLTTIDDIKYLPCLKKTSKKSFIGFGYDMHPFVDNKELFLGGVKFDTNYGFKAHSDGDVLIHSLIDSLLGAIGAGDIGEFFPDSDDKYKNISSEKLLSFIRDFIYKVGFQIINIDITILAEKPKINPYKQKIRSNLAKLLFINKSQINIKATTSERLGFIGKGKAMVVYSISNLTYRKVK